MSAWFIVGTRPNGEQIVIAEASSEPKASVALLRYRHLEGYSSITIEEERPVQENQKYTNGRGTLKLSEAAAKTPPVSATQAMKQELQLALFDTVTLEDVRQMATKLKELALGGNLAAMRLFFDLALPKDKGGAGPKTIIYQNAQPAEESEPAEPTKARPRSAGKIDAMAERAANGQPLFHPEDGEDES